MESSVRQWYELAARVANDAAAFLRSYRHTAEDVLMEEGKDIKIAADKKAEEIIVARLMQESPFGILSEEAGEMVGASNEYQWIVDPLDGSLNFSRGIPLVAVSIGLWKGDEPVLGVIADVFGNQLYGGIVGEGAWVNGAPAVVSRVMQPEKGVIITGFPSHGDFSQDALLPFVQEIQRFKKVRLIGSAALSIAYVAAGFCDVYKERGIHLWDIAAGAAIAIAAGGAVVRMDEIAAHRYDVIVTNGVIHLSS